MRAALFSLLMAGALAAQAQVPRLLAHEGRILRADSSPERGTIALTFSLYNAATAGTQLWTETQSVTLSQSGYYSAMLGKTVAIPTIRVPAWLGVTVQGEAEMTPRAQMAATLYALETGQVRSVYTQWGVSGCTGGATTLVDGWALGAHSSYAGETICLKKNVSPGPTQAYEGNLLYAMTIQGGSSAQFGNIVANARVACSVCAVSRPTCYQHNGDHACPAGFTAMYTGYLYGNHYTHSTHSQRVCMDYQSFDSSLTIAVGDTSGYIYPTRINNAIGTGIPNNASIRCAVCCAD